MSSLKPGSPATLSATILVDGRPLALLATDTVACRLYADDGTTALCPSASASSATFGANWDAGIVVVDFSDTDTADAEEPSCILRVTVTRGAQVKSWDFAVDVEGVPERTALFVKSIDVPKLRQDRLVMMAQHFMPEIDISDEYLWEKLKAAEADASRQLRVFFQPTVILPPSATQADKDALDAAGTPWAEEPGYDYDPDFFRGERWGYIVTQQKPLISVESISFVYPAPYNSIFTVPLDWVRMDKKFGHIRLVPAGSAFSAPLSAFLMQALGGGKTIPFMVHLRYTAGLTDAAENWPDLVDAVKKAAVLRLIEDTYVPQSGSISADGLSQSLSTDTQKYSDSISKKLDTLRDAIHGVRMIAL